MGPAQKTLRRRVSFTHARLTDVDLSHVVIEDANIEGLTINGVRIDELLAKKP